MKFLESTNFFVRTVMFDFINRDPKIKLKFRLVPVIHIGTKDFYDLVFKYLDECDEIFYEGAQVSGINLISNQYKRIAKKLNLVTQNESFNYEGLRHKLTHADFDLASGNEAFITLKFSEKLIQLFLLPAVLFIQSLELTRERYAKQMMTSSEEAYLAFGPIEDEEGTSRNLIMNQREQIIFNKINQKMELESSKEKTIGIMYGAGHMKTISRFLIDKLNYVPISGRFMRVFDVY